MESISKLSGMLETARDLTLEAARDASFARKPVSRPLPAVALKKLLDSRKDGDVLDGLRKVISMSYKKQPTLQYFSHVVKNIASPNLEIKKLVYSYLVQHAEEAPDMALLSINTIQKSLSDSDPRLRALALRTMSSIRVPVISQIVALGIKRAVGDMSPYVRKAAAMAIPKCYRMNPDTLPLLTEQVGILLGDKQYYVAGAAVLAFLEISPERLDLVHPHYRALVKKLVDMDEWGQLATIRLMMVYARKNFPERPRPKDPAKHAARVEKSGKQFYDSDLDAARSHEDIAGNEVNPDLELLLSSSRPLLSSRNAAVIIAVARMYLYLGTRDHVQHIIGPLISLLRAAEDIRQVALQNIVQICLKYPPLFLPYTSHFLLQTQDGLLITDLKLELLSLIFPHSSSVTRSLILAELSHFMKSSNPHLVQASVKTIGRCAQSSSTTELSSQCLKLLLGELSSSDAHLVASSLEVIRHLIQRDPQAHVKTIISLAKSLDALTARSARASIIWLVGEYASADPENNIAADVLRILIQGYPNEHDDVKSQIILLAAKVYLQFLIAKKKNDQLAAPPTMQRIFDTQNSADEPNVAQSEWTDSADESRDDEETSKLDEHPITKLWEHALLLSRYTPNYDLRDRTRLYRALLSTPHSSTDLASLLLLAPKPVPLAPSPSQARREFLLGSASLVVGTTGIKGYEDLPPWVAQGHEPDRQLRDGAAENEYVSASTGSAAQHLNAATKGRAGVASTDVVGRSNGLNKIVGPGKAKTLDDWLDEEDKQKEESDEETDSEEEGSEEEDSEEETSEEEEESEEEETDDEQGESAGLVKS